MLNYFNLGQQLTPNTKFLAARKLHQYNGF